MATDELAATSNELDRQAGSRRQPETTTVIETSRIRQVGGQGGATVVLVPVEIVRSPEHKSTDKSGGNKRESTLETGRNQRADDEARSGKAPQTKSGEKYSGPRHTAGQDDSSDRHLSAPRLSVKQLLLIALVAIVCGLVGAWGYSYFFDSSNASEQKSSSGGSQSAKGSESPKTPGPSGSSAAGG